MRLSREAAPGLAWMRTLLVNVAFVEPEPRDGTWVLVDAGLPGYASAIMRAARARFGERPPAAIIITHAHFDHVGSLEALLATWEVPVYAHVLELPHLTGRRSYPPPDPTVGGGAFAWSARLFPRAPIDVSTRVRALPDDGSVPPLPGWRWWHTPGHTDGHVSLFRDIDRALVSGDAVITVQQESLTAVLAQSPDLHGPPAYFTTDWSAALASVRDLADLTPNVLVPGHGVPLSGPGLTRGLRRLADTFHRQVPTHGRYVRTPARAREDGGYDLPPDPFPAAWKRAAGGVAVVSAVAAWAWQANRRARRRRDQTLAGS
ncbi:MAG TPA: MBL fold metallo-hydrolase [Luteitalea sp.]|nr:MBL fold metallo-hydrolase [Luteitalea sp.]